MKSTFAIWVNFLSRLEEAGMRLKEKCMYMVAEIEYLRDKINCEDLKPSRTLLSWNLHRPRMCLSSNRFLAW